MVKLTPSLVYVRTKTSVENVTKLNLWGCEVDDIELCAEMPKLQVLSLSVNKVQSLASLQHCKALEELYIRKNKIENIDELKYLRDLPKLRVLWIEENPCTEIASYRNKVIQMLPQITTLDNIGEVDFLTAKTSFSAVNRDAQNDVEDPVQDSEPAPSMSTSIVCNGPTDSTNSDSAESERTELFIPNVFSPLNRTKSLMNASMMGSYIFEEREPKEEIPGWEDFQLEEAELQEPSPRMFQSYYEGVRPPRGYGKQNVWNMPQRGAWTRKRQTNLRSQSMSPARLQRTENMLAAVRVLLDELDQDGLRQVIDEAQRRIKKRF
uniref:Protein phosphatase 1 regulatory subunit 7 n=1 Tax=Panagrolaimus sp. JU765 TaxID=591449 RepID=A0AC34RID8_9BILA